MRRRVVALVLLSLASAGGALANGKPIQIVLSYVPDVSNTGPQNATGVAELVLAEGEVRVAATSLPRLDPPEHYEAWAMNTNTNEALALGSFNTAYTTGDARLDQVLPGAIPDKRWNLFLVTIEESPTPTIPGEKRAIAGYFPPEGTEPQPNLLPNTGGSQDSQASRADRPDWMLAAGLGALALGVGVAAGYGLGRRRPVSR
jgi:hypothetical protein